MKTKEKILNIIKKNAGLCSTGIICDDTRISLKTIKKHLNEMEQREIIYNDPIDYVSSWRIK